MWECLGVTSGVKEIKFEEVSFNVNGAFISVGVAGRWAMILWRLDSFLIFPSFLRSLV